MKQSASKQPQRKSQSLVAIVMYQLPQVPVEPEPFATSMQQMFKERITAHSIDTHVFKDALPEIRLSKFMRKNQLKRKLAHFLQLQEQDNKDQKE
ncbi:MAG: hypothetical protein HW402_90 [Dehalococcoidales bacterium]|nr:hypothetical protein [Dehalococcoidales bacterium]